MVGAIGLSNQISHHRWENKDVEGKYKVPIQLTA